MISKMPPASGYAAGSEGPGVFGLILESGRIPLPIFAENAASNGHRRTGSPPVLQLVWMASGVRMGSFGNRATGEALGLT